MVAAFRVWIVRKDIDPRGPFFAGLDDRIDVLALAQMTVPTLLEPDLGGVAAFAQSSHLCRVLSDRCLARPDGGVTIVPP